MGRDLSSLLRGLTLLILLPAIHGLGDEAQSQPAAPVSIRSIQMRPLPEGARVIIELSGMAPHRLIYKKGAAEALIEFTGVRGNAEGPRPTPHESVLTSLGVEEEAALSTVVRIGVGRSVESVRSFGLSQLPGVIVDLETSPLAAPIPLLPKIGKIAGPGEQVTFDAAPASGPILPTSESVPGTVSIDEAAPTPPVVSDAATEFTPSAPPALTFPKTEDYPAGNPADYPPEEDYFPLPLLKPRTADGLSIYQAFIARDYKTAVTDSWAFFQKQAAAGSSEDEMEALALAAESRFRFERQQSAPSFDSPLNYYRQLERTAPAGALKAFAAYRVGQILEIAKSTGQALAAYRRALEPGALPFQHVVYKQMADLAAEEGRFGEAEDLLRSAADSVGQEGPRAAILAKLGEILDRQGRWEEAGAVCRQAMDLDPAATLEDPLLFYRLGRLAERKGDLGGAAALYGRLENLTPSVIGDSPDARHARLHMAGFKARASLAAGLATLKDANGALNQLTTFLRENPQSPLAPVARIEIARVGLSHKARGVDLPTWNDVPEYSDPLTALSGLMEKGADPATALEVAVELAEFPRAPLGLEDLTALGEAVGNAFEAASAKSRGDGVDQASAVATALAEAVRANQEAGQPLQGARIFRAAWDFAPKNALNPTARYYGALCYRDLGAPEEGLAHLGEIESTVDPAIAPPDAVQLHLAECEARIDDPSGKSRDSAISRLGGILERYPDTPLRALVGLRLGEAHSEAQDWAKAADCLKTAADQTGLAGNDKIHAFLLLGDAQNRLERRPQALESYYRGLFLFENEGGKFADSDEAKRLIYGLAENLHSAGDWRKASLMFEQYLAFYPKDPLAAAANYFLADCRMKLADYAEAEKSFADLSKNSEAQDFWRSMAEDGRREAAIQQARQRIGLGA